MKKIWSKFVLIALIVSIISASTILVSATPTDFISTTFDPVTHYGTSESVHYYNNSTSNYTRGKATHYSTQWVDVEMDLYALAIGYSRKVWVDTYFYGEREQTRQKHDNVFSREVVYPLNIDEETQIRFNDITSGYIIVNYQVFTSKSTLWYHYNWFWWGQNSQDNNVYTITSCNYN